MRTAIYTRLSKDDNNDELGVTRQLKACTALADRLGWTVAARFTDDDVSAYDKRKRRPGFETLLQAIKNGDVDALIVWHVDRLYRSMRDLERVIDVAEVARIQLRTVNSGDLDLSTSAGKMVAVFSVRGQPGIRASRRAPQGSQRPTSRRGQVQQ